MAKTSRNFYWDSNVFLSFINEDPNRISTISDLWDEIVSSNTDRIITSTFSIVEVAFASAEILGEPVEKAIEEKIDLLWGDPTILLVESPEIVMRIARTLVRDARSQRYRLKPYDAVQLATAMWINNNGYPISEFHTYDNLERYSELTELRICEPNVLQPSLLRDVEDGDDLNHLSESR